MLLNRKSLYFAYLLMVLSISSTVVAENESVPVVEKEHTEAPATGVWRLFDACGRMADGLLSRGDLSEEHTKLFEEIAEKLQIKHRGIKARNCGFLMRLLAYYNALAVGSLNRVYFNEDWLNQMTTEQKRFLMAHELAHHSQNHTLKFPLICYAISKIQSAVEGNYHLWCLEKKRGEIGTFRGWVEKYFTAGIPIGNKIFPIITFGIFALLIAQIRQHDETEADTKAIRQVGCDPEAAVGIMDWCYGFNTQNAPLYARIQALLQRVMMPIFALPILKQHTNHLASYADRVKHLRTLRPTKPAVSGDDQK